MITVTSTTNAPNTTIRVYFISLNAMFIDEAVSLSVQLFDANHRIINLPQLVRQMDPTEKAAFTALTATAGETVSQLVARAAAPYISSVYGVTYTTV